MPLEGRRRSPESARRRRKERRRSRSLSADGASDGGDTHSRAGESTRSGGRPRSSRASHHSATAKTAAPVTAIPRVATPSRSRGEAATYYDMSNSFVDLAAFRPTGPFSSAAPGVGLGAAAATGVAAASHLYQQHSQQQQHQQQRHQQQQPYTPTHNVRDRDLRHRRAGSASSGGSSTSSTSDSLLNISAPRSHVNGIISFFRRRSSAPGWSPTRQQHHASSGHRKTKKRFLRFSNSSSSSVDDGLFYGRGYISRSRVQLARDETVAAASHSQSYDQWPSQNHGHNHGASVAAAAAAAAGVAGVAGVAAVTDHLAYGGDHSSSSRPQRGTGDDEEILRIGRELAQLAHDENRRDLARVGRRAPTQIAAASVALQRFRQQRHSQGGSRDDFSNGHGAAFSRPNHGHDDLPSSPDDSEWESASEDGHSDDDSFASSSDGDSGLAYGSSHHLPPKQTRPSASHTASHTAAGVGAASLGVAAGAALVGAAASGRHGAGRDSAHSSPANNRYNNAHPSHAGRRQSSIVDPSLFGPQNSLRGHVTSPCGFDGRPVPSGPAGVIASDIRPPSQSDSRTANAAPTTPRRRQQQPQGPVEIKTPKPVTPVSSRVFDDDVIMASEDRNRQREKEREREREREYERERERERTGDRRDRDRDRDRRDRYDRRQDEPSTADSRYNERKQERTASPLVAAAVGSVAGAVLADVVRKDDRKDRTDGRRDDRRDDRDRDRDRKNDDYEVRRSDRRAERRKETLDERFRRAERYYRAQDEADRLKREAAGGAPRSDDKTVAGASAMSISTAAYALLAEKHKLDERERAVTKADDKPPVDPFQYQVATDAFPTPVYANTPVMRPLTPAIVTVDDGPSWATMDEPATPVKNAAPSSSAAAGPSTPAISPGAQRDRERELERQRESLVRRESERAIERARRDREQHEAEAILERTSHSTAPIDKSAVTAAEAVIMREESQYRNEPPRGRTSGRREPRDEQGRTDRDIRDEADRYYRKTAIARRIAEDEIRSRSASPSESVVEKYMSRSNSYSGDKADDDQHDQRDEHDEHDKHDQHDKNDKRGDANDRSSSRGSGKDSRGTVSRSNSDEPPVVRIVTPPEMERRHEKNKYAEPDADVRIDNKIYPNELDKYLLRAEDRRKAVHGSYEGGTEPGRGRSRSRGRSMTMPIFISRDPSCERERPLLNLVMPTPVPSPTPEKQVQKLERAAEQVEEEEAPKNRSRGVTGVTGGTKPTADPIDIDANIVTVEPEIITVGPPDDFDDDVAPPKPPPPPTYAGPKDREVKADAVDNAGDKEVKVGSVEKAGEDKPTEKSEGSLVPVTQSRFPNAKRTSTAPLRKSGWAAIIGAVTGTAAAAGSVASDTSSKKADKEEAVKDKDAKDKDIRAKDSKPEMTVEHMAGEFPEDDDKENNRNSNNRSKNGQGKEVAEEELPLRPRRDGSDIPIDDKVTATEPVSASPPPSPRQAVYDRSAGARDRPSQRHSGNQSPDHYFSAKNKSTPQGAFGDDLEFAAIVSAGMPASGFDDNIVVQDPSYWQRSSPPRQSRERGHDSDDSGAGSSSSREIVSETALGDSAPVTVRTGHRSKKAKQRERERGREEEREEERERELERQRELELEKEEKRREEETRAAASAPTSADGDWAAYTPTKKQGKNRKNKKSSSYVEEEDRGRDVSVAPDVVPEPVLGPVVSEPIERAGETIADNANAADAADVDTPRDDNDGWSSTFTKSRKQSKKDKRKQKKAAEDDDPLSSSLSRSEASETTAVDVDADPNDNYTHTVSPTPAKSVWDEDDPSPPPDRDRDRERTVETGETGEVETGKKGKKSKKGKAGKGKTATTTSSQDTDKQSFLANAGTLGAGVGLAGAAVAAIASAAGPSRTKVADASSDEKEPAADHPRGMETEEDAVVAERPQDEQQQRELQQDGSQQHESQQQETEQEQLAPHTDLLEGLATPGNRSRAPSEAASAAPSVAHSEPVIDPEIVARQIRPAIDPHFGDLLPLPPQPSEPGSPKSVISELDSDFEFPDLPDSRPETPPEQERESHLREQQMALAAAQRRRSETPVKVKTSTASPTAVPIQWLMQRSGSPSAIAGSPRMYKQPLPSGASQQPQPTQPSAMSQSAMQSPTTLAGDVTDPVSTTVPSTSYGPVNTTEGSPLASGSPVATTPSSREAQAVLDFFSTPTKRASRPQSWDSTRDLKPLKLLMQQHHRSSSQLSDAEANTAGATSTNQSPGSSSNPSALSTPIRRGFVTGGLAGVGVGAGMGTGMGGGGGEASPLREALARASMANNDKNVNAQNRRSLPSPNALAMELDAYTAAQTGAASGQATAGSKSANASPDKERSEEDAMADISAVSTTPPSRSQSTRPSMDILRSDVLAAVEDATSTSTSTNEDKDKSKAKEVEADEAGLNREAVADQTAASAPATPTSTLTGGFASRLGSVFSSFVRRGFSEDKKPGTVPEPVVEPVKEVASTTHPDTVTSGTDLDRFFDDVVYDEPAATAAAVVDKDASRDILFPSIEPALEETPAEDKPVFDEPAYTPSPSSSKKQKKSKKNKKGSRAEPEVLNVDDSANVSARDLNPQPMLTETALVEEPEAVPEEAIDDFAPVSKKDHKKKGKKSKSQSQSQSQATTTPADFTEADEMAVTQVEAEQPPTETADEEQTAAAGVPDDDFSWASWTKTKMANKKDKGQAKSVDDSPADSDRDMSGLGSTSILPAAAAATAGATAVVAAAELLKKNKGEDKEHEPETSDFNDSSKEPTWLHGSIRAETHTSSKDQHQVEAPRLTGSGESIFDDNNDTLDNTEKTPGDVVADKALLPDSDTAPLASAVANDNNQQDPAGFYFDGLSNQDAAGRPTEEEVEPSSKELSDDTSKDENAHSGDDDSNNSKTRHDVEPTLHASSDDAGAASLTREPAQAGRDATDSPTFIQEAAPEATPGPASDRSLEEQPRQQDIDTAAITPDTMDNVDIGDESTGPSTGQAKKLSKKQQRKLAAAALAAAAVGTVGADGTAEAAADNNSTTEAVRSIDQPATETEAILDADSGEGKNIDNTPGDTPVDTPVEEYQKPQDVGETGHSPAAADLDVGSTDLTTTSTPDTTPTAVDDNDEWSATTTKKSKKGKKGKKGKATEAVEAAEVVEPEVTPSETGLVVAETDESIVDNRPDIVATDRAVEPEAESGPTEPFSSEPVAAETTTDDLASGGGLKKKDKKKKKRKDSHVTFALDEPTAQPAADTATESVTEPVVEPATEQTAVPAEAPVEPVEPSEEPPVEPPVETPVEPETSKEIAAEDISAPAPTPSEPERIPAPTIKKAKKVKKSKSWFSWGSTDDTPGEEEDTPVEVPVEVPAEAPVEAATEDTPVPTTTEEQPDDPNRDILPTEPVVEDTHASEEAPAEPAPATTDAGEPYSVSLKKSKKRKGKKDTGFDADSPTPEESVTLPVEDTLPVEEEPVSALDPVVEVEPSVVEAPLADDDADNTVAAPIGLKKAKGKKARKPASFQSDPDEGLASESRDVVEPETITETKPKPESEVPAAEDLPAETTPAATPEAAEQDDVWTPSAPSLKKAKKGKKSRKGSAVLSDWDAPEAQTPEEALEDAPAEVVSADKIEEPLPETVLATPDDTVTAAEPESTPRDLPTDELPAEVAEAKDAEKPEEDLLASAPSRKQSKKDKKAAKKKKQMAWGDADEATETIEVPSQPSDASFEQPEALPDKEPVGEPVTEPKTEPVTKPTPEAVTEAITEKSIVEEPSSIETHVDDSTAALGPAAERAVEPTTESIADTVIEAAPVPIAETPADTLDEPLADEPVDLALVSGIKSKKDKDKKKKKKAKAWADFEETPTPPDPAETLEPAADSTSPVEGVPPVEPAETTEASEAAVPVEPTEPVDTIPEMIAGRDVAEPTEESAPQLSDPVEESFDFAPLTKKAKKDKKKKKAQAWADVEESASPASEPATGTATPAETETAEPAAVEPVVVQHTEAEATAPVDSTEPVAVDAAEPVESVEPTSDPFATADETPSQQPTEPVGEPLDFAPVSNKSKDKKKDKKNKKAQAWTNAEETPTPEPETVSEPLVEAEPTVETVETVQPTTETAADVEAAPEPSSEQPEQTEPTAADPIDDFAPNFREESKKEKKDKKKKKKSWAWSDFEDTPQPPADGPVESVEPSTEPIQEPVQEPVEEPVPEPTETADPEIGAAELEPSAEREVVEAIEEPAPQPVKDVADDSLDFAPISGKKSKKDKKSKKKAQDWSNFEETSDPTVETSDPAAEPAVEPVQPVEHVEPVDPAVQVPEEPVSGEPVPETAPEVSVDREVIEAAEESTTLPVAEDTTPAEPAEEPAAEPIDFAPVSSKKSKKDKKKKAQAWADFEEAPEPLTETTEAQSPPDNVPEPAEPTEPVTDVTAEALAEVEASPDREVTEATEVPAAIPVAEVDDEPIDVAPVPGKKSKKDKKKKKSQAWTDVEETPESATATPPESVIESVAEPAAEAPQEQEPEVSVDPEISQPTDKAILDPTAEIVEADREPAKQSAEEPLDFAPVSRKSKNDKKGKKKAQAWTDFDFTPEPSATETIAEAAEEADKLVEPAEDVEPVEPAVKAAADQEHDQHRELDESVPAAVDDASLETHAQEQMEEPLDFAPVPRKQSKKDKKKKALLTSWGDDVPAEVAPESVSEPVVEPPVEPSIDAIPEPTSEAVPVPEAAVQPETKSFDSAEIVDEPATQADDEPVDDFSPVKKSSKKEKRSKKKAQQQSWTDFEDPIKSDDVVDEVTADRQIEAEAGSEPAPVEVLPVADEPLQLSKRAAEVDSTSTPDIEPAVKPVSEPVAEHVAEHIAEPAADPSYVPAEDDFAQVTKKSKKDKKDKKSSKKKAKQSWDDDWEEKPAESVPETPKEGEPETETESSAAAAAIVAAGLAAAGMAATTETTEPADDDFAPVTSVKKSKKDKKKKAQLSPLDDDVPSEAAAETTPRAEEVAAVEAVPESLQEVTEPAQELEVARGVETVTASDDAQPASQDIAEPPVDDALDFTPVSRKLSKKEKKAAKNKLQSASWADEVEEEDGKADTPSEEVVPSEVAPDVEKEHAREVQPIEEEPQSSLSLDTATESSFPAPEPAAEPAQEDDAFAPVSRKSKKEKKEKKDKKSKKKSQTWAAFEDEPQEVVDSAGVVEPVSEPVDESVGPIVEETVEPTAETTREAEVVSEEPTIDTPPPVAEEDDSFDPVPRKSKKDKKKKKSLQIWDDEPEQPVVSEPLVEPATFADDAFAEEAVDDARGFEEPEGLDTIVEEPADLHETAREAVPEVVAEALPEDDWSAPASAKGKKGKKGKQVVDVSQFDASPVPATEPSSVDTPDTVEAAEPMDIEPAVTEPIAEAPAKDDFAPVTKKGKKGKKQRGTLQSYMDLTEGARSLLPEQHTESASEPTKDSSLATAATAAAGIAAAGFAAEHLHRGSEDTDFLPAKEYELPRRRTPSPSVSPRSRTRRDTPDKEPATKDVGVDNDKPVLDEPVLDKLSINPALTGMFDKADRLSSPSSPTVPVWGLMTRADSDVFERAGHVPKLLPMQSFSPTATLPSPPSASAGPSFTEIALGQERDRKVSLPHDPPFEKESSDDAQPDKKKTKVQTVPTPLAADNDPAHFAEDAVLGDNDVMYDDRDDREAHDERRSGGDVSMKTKSPKKKSKGKGKDKEVEVKSEVTEVKLDKAKELTVVSPKPDKASKKKKGGKKKIVDRRSDGDDIFDDDALWESKDPKVHEEVKGESPREAAADEDEMPGFLGKEQVGRADEMMDDSYPREKEEGRGEEKEEERIIPDASLSKLTDTSFDENGDQGGTEFQSERGISSDKNDDLESPVLGRRDSDKLKTNPLPMVAAANAAAAAAAAAVVTSRGIDIPDALLEDSREPTPRQEDLLRRPVLESPRASREWTPEPEKRVSTGKGGHHDYDYNTPNRGLSHSPAILPESAGVAGAALLGSMGSMAGKSIPHVVHHASGGDLRRSASSILAPVLEETYEDEGDRGHGRHYHGRDLDTTPSRSQPRRSTEHQHRAATPDANRDSGFAEDNAHSLPTAPTAPKSRLSNETQLRDSGVHLRDWSGHHGGSTSNTAADLQRSPDSVRSVRHSSDDKRSTSYKDAGLAAGILPAVRSRPGSTEPGLPGMRSVSDNTHAASRDRERRLMSSPMPSDAGSVSGAMLPQQAPRRSASNTSLVRRRTPDPLNLRRPESPGINRAAYSSTPPLRRIDRRMSGDLRSLSNRSQTDLSSPAALAGAAATAAGASALGPFPPDNDTNKQHTASTSTRDEGSSSKDLSGTTASIPVANEGRVRDKGGMTDVYDGYGEGRIGSPRSPTRPHSMRRRQSMQVMELENRVEQLMAENRMLTEARSQAEQSSSSKAASSLAERDNQIDALKRSLDFFQKEVKRLTEVNEGLNSAINSSAMQHNERFRQLETDHAQATRDLASVASERNEHLETTKKQLDDKDAEIAALKAQLQAAQDEIRAMQAKILASMPADGADLLRIQDVDYFDRRCQQLCTHVQQWVLRFSKFSDLRACRLTAEINDEKTVDRLDNAVLDGSDVDDYLRDRVHRRDIFMAMTMYMVWEFVFTRYLFGMDREQRQKIKSLEKTLLDVGPISAVRQWRAVTLTLLMRQPSFREQRDQDTEAVVQAILQTLSAILPPPTNKEEQIETQLRRVIREAVDLSIEMRCQRAEYMMLPPLQPEYDGNGELVETVAFNPELMTERDGRGGGGGGEGGDETAGTPVRIVLFPLVVKKGDDAGQGDDEIVVCPAQVLVAAPLPRRSASRAGTAPSTVDQPASKRRMMTPSSDAGGVSLLSAAHQQSQPHQGGRPDNRSTISMTDAGSIAEAQYIEGGI